MYGRIACRKYIMKRHPTVLQKFKIVVSSVGKMENKGYHYII